MSEKNDINDLREKLRRQKKEKKQSSDPHLLGREDQESESTEPEQKKDDRETKVDAGKRDKDVLDDSVITESHHDYDDEKSIEKKATTKESKNNSPKKEKKKFKLPRFKLTPAGLITLAALIFIIILGVLVWYVFSDMSDVKEITYSGNHVISDEELSNRLQFTEGDKMFSINTTQAKENIELLPVIVEAEVERDWWNTVHVNVNEYNIIAYIENEGTFNPVMENARVLRGYPVAPSIGPILYHFEGEEFENTVTELQNVDKDILSAISEIHFSPSDSSQTRIHIFMNDGQEIVADYRDFGEKMNHYVGMKQEIGEDNDGIIDIEIGSSFLPYGSTEAEEVKQGIYDDPVQAEYIDDINASLSSVKETLNVIGQEEETEETEEEADENGEDSNSSE